MLFRYLFPRIVAVLLSAFDSSFTASASYVIRSMLGIDSSHLAVPMFVLFLRNRSQAHANLTKLFDVFVYFIGKRTAGIPAWAVTTTCLSHGAISGSAPATVAAVVYDSIPLLRSWATKRIFQRQLLRLRRTRSHHTAKHVPLSCMRWQPVSRLCDPFSCRNHSDSDRSASYVLCILSLRAMERTRKDKCKGLRA